MDERFIVKIDRFDLKNRQYDHLCILSYFLR